MARAPTLPSVCRSCLQTITIRPGASTTRRRLISSPNSHQTITSRELHGVDWSKPASASTSTSTAPTESNIRTRRVSLDPEPQTSEPEPEALLQQAFSPRKSRTTNTDISVWRRTTQQETLEKTLLNTPASSSATQTTGSEPYHIHVYAHRHNMHLTFTEPGRAPILSLSGGDIGLRKSHRATYDASYQLTTYFFRKMMEKQWRIGGKKVTSNPMQTLESIKSPRMGNSGTGIEIIFRGFGAGREAFQKALLGPEGRLIKGLVTRVTDATRLKFGGSRSPNVRRLG